MKRAIVLVAAVLLTSAAFAQSLSAKEEEKRYKAQEKQEKKERKQRESLAAFQIPFVTVQGSPDKAKAEILARIGSWGGFTLISDSNYQLRFQREVRWASFMDGMAHESTSSRPTKETLALTFVEREGRTNISTDRSVTRESNYGNTQTDSMNNSGKWNLELQSFLDEIRDEVGKQASASTAPPAPQP